MAFRFEYYENVIAKHHMNKIDWRQCAMWAFHNHFGNDAYTIASIKMLDDNTVEIIKCKKTDLKK